EWCPGEDGLADDGVLPGRRTAFRVEGALDAVEELRPVVAAADVVLARPHRLDGNPRGLGDLHGLADEIRGGRRAASEAAAEERRVDGDVLRRDAGDLRSDHLVHGL